MTHTIGRRGARALWIASLLVLATFCFLFAGRTQALAAPDEPAVVETATVDELLAAIAPNTKILLTGSRYDLTSAQNYGGEGGQYYSWSDIWDGGWELVIENVEGLTLEAEPGVEIVTVPRYACVLKFSGCRGLTLRGFTAGHTEGAGYCTGAVIGLSACRDVRMDNCDLYGCGTYGLELYNCRGVHAYDTVIRSCSYGAIYADHSSDILLDGCTLRDIQGIGALLTMSACHDGALINSTVQNCTADSLTDFYSAKNITLAGCELTGNSFVGVFYSSPYPVIVSGCAFRDNSLEEGWYREPWNPSERAVDPDGRIYSDAELEALTLQPASWSAPEAPVLTAAPEPGEDGMVHVHNVDELLAAIAPDTTIYLEDGVYDLSQATGYGLSSGDYWYWMDCYDGPGLAIRGADNLCITAAGPHRARIVAEPRFCEVLSFESCCNLSLSGFTAGHTVIPEANGCAGGVLSLMDCHNFRVEDCSLYGCGILGVSLMSCAEGEIVHTEIHDCTEGAFFFYDSRDVVITGCNIHDIPGYPYQLYDCWHISADGETLPAGASW